MSPIFIFGDKIGLISNHFESLRINSESLRITSDHFESVTKQLQVGNSTFDT